jgi:hypothetical protein
MTLVRPHSATAIIRQLPIGYGYTLCFYRKSLASQARLAFSDKATIYAPEGNIYWSGRNASDGASLVRLIRSGKA